MKRWYIVLGLDRIYYRTIQSRFGYEARALGLSVQQTVHGADPACSFSSAIFTAGKADGQARWEINSLNRLVVYFPADMTGYINMTEAAEKQEFFIRLMKDGLSVIRKDYPDLAAAVDAGCDAFREAGYRCEWVLKSGKVPGTKYRYDIRCGMDIERFLCSFRLMEGGETVFTEHVLETKPDELHYKPFVSRAKADGAGVSVYGKGKLGMEFYRFEYRRIPRILYGVRSRLRVGSRVRVKSFGGADPYSPEDDKPYMQLIGWTGTVIADAEGYIIRFPGKPADRIVTQDRGPRAV